MNGPSLRTREGKRRSPNESLRQIPEELLLNARRCPASRSPPGSKATWDGMAARWILFAESADDRYSSKVGPPPAAEAVILFLPNRANGAHLFGRAAGPARTKAGQIDARPMLERLGDGCRAEAAIVRACLPGIAVSIPTVAKRKPRDAIAAERSSPVASPPRGPLSGDN
jgi:hypothetical protein